MSVIKQKKEILMFQDGPQLKKKKHKKEFVLLIVQIHIMLFLLVGVLFMMSRFKNKPMPLFSILFGSPSNSLSHERKAQILIPKDQETPKNHSSSPSNP